MTELCCSFFSKCFGKLDKYKINKDFDHSIDLTFDIVRMSPSGDTIIAGKTQPKIEVQIYDGNEKIGSTFSDEYGDWIWMSDSPLDEGIKKFSLKHVDDNGNQHISDQNVIVFLEDESKNIPKIIPPLIYHTEAYTSDIVRFKIFINVLKSPPR